MTGNSRFWVEAAIRFARASESFDRQALAHASVVAKGEREIAL
jgi:hypothetical protein